MTSGPSKEELQNYWDNSRQYFDELARHYQTADPEYYNKFIAPFYSNPFNAVSGNKRANAGIRIVVLLIFIITAVGAAAFVFFMASQENNNKEIDKKIGSEKQIERETKPVKETETAGFPDDDLILGSKYIAEKDYDKAEEHLRKVKRESKDYEQAQQLLESIKYLRKYDK